MNDGRFKKGQSGNPAGRRIEKLADSLAHKYGPRALEYINEVLNDETQETRYRVDCAKYLVDRAYGKAAQAVEVTGKGGDAIKTITDIRVIFGEPTNRTTIEFTPIPKLPEA